MEAASRAEDVPGLNTCGAFVDTRLKLEGRLSGISVSVDGSSGNDMTSDDPLGSSDVFVLELILEDALAPEGVDGTSIEAETTGVLEFLMEVSLS